METKKISTLTALRKVTRLSKIYLMGKNDINRFLERSSFYFNNYVRRNYSDRVLFYCLSIRNKAGTFEFVVSNKKDNGYYFFEETLNKSKSKIEKAISELVKEAKSGNTANFTQVLLGDRNAYGKDLFILQDTSQYNGIIEDDLIESFYLSNLIFDKNQDTFLNANKDQIQKFMEKYKISPDEDLSTIELQKVGKYLWHLKNVEYFYKSENLHKKLHLHYIRPSMPVGEYNLMLTIATNKEFSEEKLGILNLLLFRVTALTSMAKNKNVIWDEYVKKIESDYSTNYTFLNHVKIRLLYLQKIYSLPFIKSLGVEKIRHGFEFFKQKLADCYEFSDFSNTTFEIRDEELMNEIEDKITICRT